MPVILLLAQSMAAEIERLDKLAPREFREYVDELSVGAIRIIFRATNTTYLKYKLLLLVECRRRLRYICCLQGSEAGLIVNKLTNIQRLKVLPEAPQYQREIMMTCLWHWQQLKELDWDHHKVLRLKFVVIDEIPRYYPISKHKCSICFISRNHNFRRPGVIYICDCLKHSRCE